VWQLGKINSIWKKGDTQESAARNDNLYMTKRDRFLVALTLLFRECKNQLPSMFLELVLQED
jgi:hypothetical protein